ncbi:hypothetical protein BD310DRAFT_812880 [Dichomitus squalens]|uniref:Uncharacterized protein n=1 Tax=Dichomitus squalens TaxID=114155 RepID=A0A4Q9Q3X0_9APHY|nr:hypothetical protein BD310DRAFT_812880 [Dichomitus squalens]
MSPTLKMPEPLILAWSLQQNLDQHPEGPDKLIITRLLAMATTTARLACDLAQTPGGKLEIHCVLQDQFSKGTVGVLNAFSAVFDTLENELDHTSTPDGSGNSHLGCGQDTANEASSCDAARSVSPAPTQVVCSHVDSSLVASLTPPLMDALTQPLLSAIQEPLICAIQEPLLAALQKSLLEMLSDRPLTDQLLVSLSRQPHDVTGIPSTGLTPWSRPSRQTSTTSLVPSTSVLSSKALDPVATSSSGFKHKKKRVLPPSWLG